MSLNNKLVATAIDAEAREWYINHCVVDMSQSPGVVGVFVS
jgi:hypothetical protein